MLTVQTVSIVTWAAQYNTWLLNKLTLKGIVFSFSFLVNIVESRLAFGQAGSG